LIVTFCPAEVVKVNVDPETLLTVPTEPPAAGPDRAFDPPSPPGNCAPAAAGGAAASEFDDRATAYPADPATAQINTATAISRRGPANARRTFDSFTASSVIISSSSFFHRRTQSLR
jgi:hypothetical protein